MEAREIQKSRPAKLSQRALSSTKVLQQLASRARLTTEELKEGPISHLGTDENGHEVFQHENHAGTFTCHSKFFEIAAS